MSEMFSNCLSLNEINLSHFNTEKVTNMMDMFSLCQSLKEVNLSNFKTDNVTDMSYMFSGCSSIKELNLYTFIKEIEKSMDEVKLDSNLLHRSINKGFSGGEKKKNEYLCVPNKKRT